MRVQAKKQIVSYMIDEITHLDLRTLDLALCALFDQQKLYPSTLTREQFDRAKGLHYAVLSWLSDEET